MICKVCKEQIDNDAYFCPRCGTIVKKSANSDRPNDYQKSNDREEHSGEENIKRCLKCGNRVYENQTYCIVCGAPIKELKTTTHNKARSHKKTLIIGLVAIIFALTASAFGFAAFFSSQHPHTNQDDTTTVVAVEDPISTMPESTPEPTPVPTVLAQPQFTLSSYSSEHASSSDGVTSDTYYAEHLVDGDVRTAWIPVCEDDGLMPIGHWVEFTADTPQPVSGITIVNGFAKDDRKYFNNYRVRVIRIIIDGNDEMKAVLSDLGCGVEEYIPFGKTYQASRIRIVIEEVYETNPVYKEAAISEISFNAY